jgi:hypothetical protein
MNNSEAQQSTDEVIFAKAIGAGGFAHGAERLTLNSESGELRAIFGDWAVTLPALPRRVRHGHGLRRRSQRT